MLCFVFTIFVLDNFILSAHARHVVCPVVSRSYLCPPISEAYYLILLRLVLCPVLPVPAAHHSLSSDCLLGFDLCLTTGFCACPFALDVFILFGLMSADLLVCTPLSAVFSTPSPPHRPVTCWQSQLLFFCSANLLKCPFMLFYL